MCRTGVGFLVERDDQELFGKGKLSTSRTDQGREVRPTDIVEVRIAGSCYSDVTTHRQEVLHSWHKLNFPRDEFADKL